MSKIYLDTNIIIDLYDGEYPWLLSAIMNSKKDKVIDFPYSSTHIEELTALKLKNTIEKQYEIRKRLDFVSNLSSDIYFCNDMLVTEFKKDNPHSVFNTLNDLPIKINYKEFFANLISYDSLKKSREQIDFDSQFLNNVNPQIAIEEIDKIISKSKDKLNLKNINEDISILGIIKKGMQISEDTHKGTSYHNITSKKENYALENFIVMLFSLLDSLGFWSDKREVYSKGSRFADAIHCFNGVYCDYVISNDTRFCNKSNAVYKYLDFKTEVYNIKKDEIQIKNILGNVT